MPLTYLDEQPRQKKAGLTYLDTPEQVAEAVQAMPAPTQVSAESWDRGEISEDALTPPQALGITLERARSRRDPAALARGAVEGAGQLIGTGLSAAKQAATYQLANPLTAGPGFALAAGEGVLRGAQDLGQIGKDVAEGMVLDPLAVVRKAAETRGWPATLGTLAQASPFLALPASGTTPFEKLANVFPQEVAEVSRDTLIRDRRTQQERKAQTEGRQSLLSDVATAGAGRTLESLGVPPEMAASIAGRVGGVVTPPEGLGDVSEVASYVLDPTALAAPGASLVGRVGKVASRTAKGSARRALLEGFERAAREAPPSRASFVAGPDGAVRPQPPPLEPPVLDIGDGPRPMTDLQPLLDRFAEEARRQGSAAPSTAQKALDAAGRAKQATGEVLGQAAGVVEDFADRNQGPLSVLGAAAGLVKGPAGALVGSQIPRAVRQTAAWAKNLSRAGSALRTIAATDWKSSVPVWRQIAKDPEAPQWLVRGVSARVAGRLTAGAAVEEGLRSGARIAGGTAEGAAIDAGFAAADPQRSGEDIGSEAGPGGLIGFLSSSATARGAVRQRKEEAIAHDAMKIAARAIEAGADPLVVARTSDRLMQTAAVMETMLRGTLSGRRNVKVDLLDAAQFRQRSPQPDAAAFFDEASGRVVVNLEAADAEGRQLHEIGHGILSSAAASNPAIVEHFRSLLGPDGLSRARQDYQQALGTEVPQDDTYIVGELWSEAVANALRGADLSEGVPAALGRTGMRSFFRDGDVRKALRDPGTLDLVRQQMGAVVDFRPAVDLDREPGVKIRPDMAGRHPAFPVEQQAGGSTGNDFVQVTPDGRVVATPASQVRTRVRSRRREMLTLFPDTEPVSDAGTSVAVRRTPSGLTQKTGTTLGEQFYATARSFGEATKNMLRRVEQAIAAGETMAGWYQQVGQGDGWAASVRESLGAIEAQYKDFIPYAFKVDKQGNLLVENYSLTALERKAAQWAARTGTLSLELWSGDIGAFRQDVQTYLKNHAEGRPGAEGLGDAKRNLINVFLVGGNRAFEAVNPLRPLAKGKDRQGIVRSYRADRLQTVEPSDVRGYTKPDYGKQVRNLSPKITPEQDAAYLKAAEAGDTEAAQRMVDRAAKRAGYTTGPVWHRGAPWTVADFDRIDRGLQLGLHVGSEKQIQNIKPEWMGEKRVDQRLLASVKNPLRLEDFGVWSWEYLYPQLEQRGIKFTPDEIREASTKDRAGGEEDRRWLNRFMRQKITEAGYDGIVYLNRTEGVDHASLQKDPRLPKAQRTRADYTDELLRAHGAEDSFIVFSPEKIKSADPITRDDAGEPIPLSERFNPTSKDIRYSAPIQRELGRNADFAKPPTDEEAIAALDVAKRPKFGAARELPAGTPVALRIDIPAFNRTGKYVVSVHKPDGQAGGPGTIIGYDTVARVRNPRFVVKPGVEKIRDGAKKFPVATVDGALINDRSIPADIDQWTPVGIDPKDHSYFYDKKTDQPVISGSGALSVGNTVFVKDPVYGDKADFRYTPEIKTPDIEKAVADLDRLGDKAAPQVKPNELPYPKNPDPESVALPARWGVVNRNIVGMPRAYSEVKGIIDRQVARLVKVVEENPDFARESARFYLDMAESALLSTDAAFPSAVGLEKWRGAELMLRFLALGSPRTGVSANATKSSYSTSAAASDFTAGYKIGFGSQQVGAKNTLAAWKEGRPFDMHGEGVDNKVRNFYMNGLAELLDLARAEGDEASIDYLFDAAAAGLEMTKPGEKLPADQHAEVQRLLDGMATVDMWDMAAKGYAWPGWISNKKARPGDGKSPWVWTQDKYATKATIGSPAWKKVAAELSGKKRAVKTPADLRYQEARALRIEGNKDWDATTWAERIKQPFGPETEFTTFTNVSEAGLTPGGAGPLYDAQQAIDGLIADEINRRGMAFLFGKEKLLARNAQEILWALERLDNPVAANNELALFGNSFKALAAELNRIRSEEGPKNTRGDTILKAMESAYAVLANQDLPIEVVSAGTTPEARAIQGAIERLRQEGVEDPVAAVTQTVADGLHEFLTQASDKHGLGVVVDRVSVGSGGYTENGVPSVSPNMVLRLRGAPESTKNLLEVLSRAMDQDGGNIIRRPTIRELNTPGIKLNNVITFRTAGMSKEQKTAFFMDLNALKDANGESFFTGFTETADGMAIGDQFYGGNMSTEAKAKRLEILRIIRKHGVPDYWTDTVIIETVYRSQPEPEGLREQPFAKDVMAEISRRIESAAKSAEPAAFPQTLDEEGRTLRRIEESRSVELSGKKSLVDYFVNARAAIDTAVLRGVMDEARGEQLKGSLTEIEKLRTPSVLEQAAAQAAERAKAKALEARRKARKKALLEKQRAKVAAEKAARQRVLDERRSRRESAKQAPNQ